MIPTMIYEEAQGNAIIRALLHHKNSKPEKLPELQKIISNLCEGINTRLQRKSEQPKISSNRELPELTVEASKANQEIKAIQTIGRTYDGENLLNRTKQI